MYMYRSKHSSFFGNSVQGYLETTKMEKYHNNLTSWLNVIMISLWSAQLVVSLPADFSKGAMPAGMQMAAKLIMPCMIFIIPSTQ